MRDGVRLPSPRPFEWWSPTTYNTLRRCPLALAYDCDPILRRSLRRPSTFSVLGEVSHSLTEELWKGNYNHLEPGALKSMLSQRWNELATSQHAELSRSWAPAEPPNPTEWPYYANSKSRTIARLLQDVERFRPPTATNLHPAGFVEDWLIDAEMRLRGRPDRVQWTSDGYRVIDLKAGPHVEELTDTHLQQLLLYAHLVSVNTQLQPIEVAVVNAIGVEFVRTISTVEVASAVEEFRDRSESFNALIENPSALESQATPSKDACRRCAYRGVCPAFKAHSSTTWDARILQGRVSAVPSSMVFTMKVIAPQDVEDEEVTVMMSGHEPVAVGDFVACVDLFTEGRPLRLEWNSLLIRNGLKSDLSTGILDSGQ